MKKIFCKLVLITSLLITNLVADITNGLVAHYEFEGNTLDSSGSNFNLMIRGGQGIKQYGTGKQGQAYLFDNATDNSLIAADTNLSGTVGTISYWFKPINIDGVQSIFIMDDGSGGTELDTFNDNSTLNYAGGGVGDTKSAVFIDDTWTHITVTFNGLNSAKLYVNGVLTTPTTDNTDNISLEKDIYLGNWNNDCCISNGFIDDVRVYNRELIQSDITEIYNYSKTQLVIQNHGGVLQIPSNGDIEIDLNSSMTQGTLEFWINTKHTTSSYNSVAGIYDDNGSIDLSIRDDVINYIVNDGNSTLTFIGQKTINDNTWHHVALSFDGTTFSGVYVDGENDMGDVAGSSLSNFSLNNPKLKLNKDKLINMMIDDVRIWNTPRTQLQINQTKNYQLDENETDLVAYYNFDERIGNKVYDISSNDNDGTIDDDILRLNFLGDNLTFSGSGNTIQVDTTLNTSSYSKALWFKAPTSPTGNFISTQGAGHYFWYASGSKIGIAHNGTATSGTTGLLSTHDYNDGQWHHAVATYEGSTLSLYIDGELESQNTSVTTPPSDTTIEIGSFNGGNGSFNGEMAELSIWNKALTPSEITKIIHSSLKGNESGLVGYWPLDEGNALTIYDKSSFSNNGTLSGTSWSFKAPKIFGNTIYTSQNILTNSKIITLDQTNTPIYSEVTNNSNVTVIDNLLQFQSFLEGNQTANIHNSEDSLTEAITFTTYISDDNINLSLLNLNTNENNISKITLIGQDGTDSNSSFDINGLIDGENNISTLLSEDGNYSLQFTLSDNSTWWYNFSTQTISSYNDFSSVFKIDSHVNNNIVINTINSNWTNDIQSGLIAHYEFEDNINDSANDYNLSVAGGGSELYNNIGKYGKSYIFNGTDNYLKTATNALDENQTGTISFWIKDSVDNGQAYVVMQDNSGSSTFSPSIYTDGSKNLGAYGNIHQYPLDQTPIGQAMFDGNWHHIVLTFSGTNTATFYFDGQYVIPSDQSADEFKIGTTIALGVQYANNITPQSFLSGEMDDVKIYNRVLSSSDITKLYNYETPKVIVNLSNYNSDEHNITAITLINENGIDSNISLSAITDNNWSTEQSIDGNYSIKIDTDDNLTWYINFNDNNLYTQNDSAEFITTIQSNSFPIFNIDTNASQWIDYSNIELTTLNNTILLQSINELTPNGTIKLNVTQDTIINLSGTLLLDKNMTINNISNYKISLNASDLHRAIEIGSSAHVKLTGIIIENGHTSYDNGAGIFNNGNLILKKVIVRNNFATNGNGAGIFNNGTLNIESSSLYNNNSELNGGAIQNVGELTLLNTTISNNIAGENGGAVYINSGDINISHTTIAYNHSGALSNNQNEPEPIDTCDPNSASYDQTICSEKKGGGIYQNSGTVNIANSIIIHNTDGINHAPNVFGIINSYGNNIFGILDGNETINQIAGNDKINITSNVIENSLSFDSNLPQLNLTTHSFAANKGTCQDINGNQITNDQNGTSRPLWGQCDIGAVEATEKIVTPVLVNLNLTNVKLSKNNITNIQIINQDNNESFNIPDFNTSISDGENNYSSLIYDADDNYSIELTVKKFDTDTFDSTWYYNFSDQKLYPNIENNTSFFFTPTIENNLSMDLNNSNFNYYILNTNFTNNNNKVTKVIIWHQYNSTNRGVVHNINDSIDFKYSEEGNYEIRFRTLNERVWHFNPLNGDINNSISNYVDLNSSGKTLNIDLNSSNFEIIDLNIYGTNDNDNIEGTPDNDMFNASSGNDLIDGKNGEDTVRFEGNANEYTIFHNDNSVIISGQNGITQLSNIELLTFSDKNTTTESYKRNSIINTYSQIEEPISLENYNATTALHISLPFDFYWFDNHQDFSNQNTKVNFESGNILLTKNGLYTKIDKIFKNNLIEKSTSNMNYSVDNNLVTVSKKTNNEVLFELKIAEKYNNLQLQSIYNNFNNIDINFTQNANGYKVLKKTIKESIELSHTIFNFETNSSYTSLESFLGHTPGLTNELNNSKILLFDNNTTAGNLIEYDTVNDQIINYTAGTWQRVNTSKNYIYDDNGTTKTGITNEIISIKPSVIGYKYNQAIVLADDGYLHQARYEEANSTSSFIQLNSYAVNEISQSVVNDFRFNTLFEYEDKSQVFENTQKAYNELFYTRIVDERYYDNNVTYDNNQKVFNLTANKKNNLSSRASIQMSSNEQNITSITTTVNLSDANSSYNKGYVWALFKDVLVSSNNDLNITSNKAHIYAGITIQANGLSNYITIYDENWNKRWTLSNINDYNSTILASLNSSIMIDKKVQLGINIANNTINFEAYDENNNTIGTKLQFQNQNLTFNTIAKAEMRAKVSDFAQSADKTSMQVFSFSQNSLNTAPILSQQDTNIILTEGNSAVTTINAFDLNNDHLSYSLTGTDSSLFNIDQNGHIQFNLIPNYESPQDFDKNNIYQLTVIVTDGHQNDSKNLEVTILNDSYSTRQIMGENWSKGEYDYKYMSNSITNQSTFATLTTDKINNDNSILELTQKDMGQMVESSLEINLSNIDDTNTYISFFLANDNGSKTQIVLTSKSAKAFIYQNGSPISSSSIYDYDGTNYFDSKQVKLNTWFIEGNIHFNITDIKNNQLGREVILSNNNMNSFTSHNITMLHDDTNNNANQSAELQFYGITSNSTITHNYYKRLSHLEFNIDTATYDNASAQDINNTQLFQLRTNVDWNSTKYVNLKIGQINPYDNHIFESGVEINHKNIISNEELIKRSVSKNNNIIVLSNESQSNDEIKYQGSVNTNEMNQVLAKANVPFTLINGAGHKLYSKRVSTHCSIEGINTNTNYNDINNLILNNTEANQYNNSITRNKFNSLKVLQFSTETNKLVEHDIRGNQSNIDAGTWSIKENVICSNNGVDTPIDIIDINSTLNGYENTYLGYKNGVVYQLDYTKENRSSEIYFFDKIAIQELSLEYGITKTPIKQKVLNNTYNYISLPSNITLCTANFQSALGAICNQDYNIDTIFSQVDTVFKHTGFWSYWSPNVSVSNNQYNLDILNTINNKEGLIVKISNSSKTLNLPYNIFGKIETDIIDLYQTGWHLTSSPLGYLATDIENMTNTQNKTLKYILQLNNNNWNVYAPLNNDYIDKSISRINTINKEESFWIYVE